MLIVYNNRPRWLAFIIFCVCKIRLMKIKKQNAFGNHRNVFFHSLRKMKPSFTACVTCIFKRWNGKNKTTRREGRGGGGLVTLLPKLFCCSCLGKNWKMCWSFFSFFFFSLVAFKHIVTFFFKENVMQYDEKLRLCIVVHAWTQPGLF